jgi:hypothetical protein
MQTTDAAEGTDMQRSVVLARFPHSVSIFSHKEPLLSAACGFPDLEMNPV